MIEYTDSVENVTAEMLEGYFENWRKPRTPKEHLQILKNSDHVVLAINTETDNVVGFVSALTDGIQSAFIPLLEVLPAYRKRGIGTALISRMLHILKGIPAIDVMCDPPMQTFYSKFGMTPSTGMIIRDYGNDNS